MYRYLGLYQVAFNRITVLASSSTPQRTQQYASVVSSLPPCSTSERILLLIIICILFILNVNLCQGEVCTPEDRIIGNLHRWVDKDCNTHITDYAPPKYPEQEVETAPSKEQPMPATVSKENQSITGQVQTQHAPSKTPIKKTEIAPIAPTAQPKLPELQVTHESEKPAMPSINQPQEAIAQPQDTIAQSQMPVSPLEQQHGKPTLRPIKPVPTPLTPAPVADGPLVRLPNTKDIGIRQIIILGLLLGSILYFLFTLFSIAKKLRLDKPWIALIPIANAFTLIKAADKPIWWLGLLFVPGVNIAIGVMLWIAICERLSLDAKNGLAMLYFSPLTVPVVAVLFTLFNPAGIILSSIFIIYPIAVMFCSSMFLLPVYFLRQANYLTAQKEVSKIFNEEDLSDQYKEGKAAGIIETKKPSTSVKIIETIPIPSEEYEQDAVGLSAFEPELKSGTSPESQELDSDIPILAEGTVDLSAFEPSLDKSKESKIDEIGKADEGLKPKSETIDLSSFEPLPEDAESMPEPKMKENTVDLSQIESATEAKDEPQHIKTTPEEGTVDLSNFEPPTKETNMDDTARLLIKDIEDSDFRMSPDELVNDSIISDENDLGNNDGEIPFNFDLDAQPAGIMESHPPTVEKIEGLSADIDLDAEPAGIIEAHPPTVEKIEGLAADIDLDAEPAGIIEAHPPTVEKIEGLAADIDLDAEPAGIIEAHPPTVENIEELSADIEFEVQPEEEEIIAVEPEFGDEIAKK